MPGRAVRQTPALRTGLHLEFSVADRGDGGKRCGDPASLPGVGQGPQVQGVWISLHQSLGNRKHLSLSPGSLGLWQETSQLKGRSGTCRAPSQRERGRTVLTAL